MTFKGSLQITCTPRKDVTGAYFCVEVFPANVENADPIFNAISIGNHAPLAVADALEEIVRKIRARANA